MDDEVVDQVPEEQEISQETTDDSRRSSLVWSAESASVQIAQLHEVLTDVLTRLAAAETKLAALEEKRG